jgi:molybdopterin-guanine dinucleotide biosynthesis protein
MSGRIKKMLDEIVQKKSGGKTVLVNVVMTKLILKGIDPSKFSASSPDDPVIIAKVATVAHEMGVVIN